MTTTSKTTNPLVKYILDQLEAAMKKQRAGKKNYHEKAIDIFQGHKDHLDDSMLNSIFFGRSNDINIINAAIKAGVCSEEMTFVKIAEQIFPLELCKDALKIYTNIWETLLPAVKSRFPRRYNTLLKHAEEKKLLNEEDLQVLKYGKGITAYLSGDQSDKRLTA